jgi:hypothetical protein
MTPLPLRPFVLDRPAFPLYIEASQLTGGSR